MEKPPLRSDDIPLSTLSVVVLLEHLIRGAADPKIGHVHAEKTLQELIRELDKPIKAPLKAVEDALWAVNLLAKKEQFKHPLGWSHEKFLKTLVPGKKVNETYNWLEDKE